MIRRRENTRHRRFLRRLTIVLSLIASGGCALTATRPIQEMSNADAALHAAKDVSADSLVPELYRAANDHYFKAKRDYRLKNFDTAKDHALKATRLAEQAEFEAYRMGGATPEAASRATPMEGSSSDADMALKGLTSAPPPEDGRGSSEPKANGYNNPRLTSDKATPLAPSKHPEPEPKGTDYNVLKAQQEAEREAAERAKAEKEKKAEQSGGQNPSPAATPAPAPAGATPGGLPGFGAGGPTGPSSPVPSPQVKVPAVPTFPENVSPKIGLLPPIISGNTPPSVNSPPRSQDDLTPYKGSDPPFVDLDPAEPTPPEIQPLGAGIRFESVGNDALGKQREMKPLGEDGIPVRDGLEEVRAQPMRTLEEQTRGKSGYPGLFGRPGPADTEKGTEQ